jgi:hypothetical protein
MEDHLITQENEKTIHILMSRFRGGDIDKIILKHLRGNLEGMCDNFGYIQKNSISLISNNIGKIGTVDGKSVIEYKVRYSFRSLYPSNGDEYQCVIDSITKMGLIGYLKGVSSLSESPLIIIIPQKFTDSEGQSGMDAFTVGDVVSIEVVNSRVKFKNRQIQVVGKII